MNKISILLIALCMVLFSGGLSAWEGSSPEIRGDQEVIGNFDGFEYDGDEISILHIKLAETGYRVSLPIAENVEYLYKPEKYVSYDPQKLIFLATIKAIVVNEKVVQVIVLEVPS